VTLERDAGRQAEGDYDAYFVNVARAGRSEDRFFLTLVYRKKEKVFSAVMLGGRLNLEFPRLGSPGTAAVQQMRAAVWAPKEFTLVGTPDQFTVERTATWRQALWGTKPPGARQDELESWIGGGSTGLFEFPVAGYGTEYHNLGGAEKLEVSFWRSAWVTGILSIGCLAIGFVLARSTWENRLGVVLSAAVATAVYGLFDSDAMVYWVSTSRYGLLGAAAWWVVSALLTIPLPSRAPLAALGAGTGTETTAATSENAAPAAGSTAGDAAMPPGTVTPPAAGHAFQEPEGTGGGDSAADA
jgi:hypothetical protein